MLFKRLFFYRLYIVFVIALIWVLFSILFLYNIVEIDEELLRKRRLGYFSLAFAIIGFIVAGAETFFLKNAFRKLPLWLSTLLRMTMTFMIFLAVSLVVITAYYVLRYNGTYQEFKEIFFEKMVFTPSFLMFMIDLGVLSFLSIIMLEVTDKYGPGGIRNLLRGKYNKPRKENRIFLFLDINDSTTIAERLGHDKYFNLLKDFFADITDPIINNAALIYQYVGDEVILSWINTPANKLKCLQFLKEAFYLINDKEEYYKENYGVVPTFKAGIHSGYVTAGYIGIVKKELVFSGDTLNTAARIRSKCNDFKKAFLVSANFLNGSTSLDDYQIQQIGEITLRGRQETEKLYSLGFDNLRFDRIKETPKPIATEEELTDYYKVK